jgi:hypothetical protein
VSQVSDVDLKFCEMTVLRKSGDNGKIFTFPWREVKYWVQEQVVEKLQASSIDQKTKHNFYVPVMKVEWFY